MRSNTSTTQLPLLGSSALVVVLLLLVLLSSTTTPVVVDAAQQFFKTAAFDFGSAPSNEDIQIYGSVPDDGGVSIIHDITNIKSLNVSVIFGKNTGLIIRNLKVDVGFYIGGWLKDGVNITIENNRISASSSSRPCIWIAPRIMGTVSNIEIRYNYAHRITSLIDVDRSAVVVIPYTLEVATETERIQQLYIHHNQFQLLPLDGGIAQAITIVAPQWLYQPNYDLIRVSDTFILCRGVFDPFPPLLTALNFSVMTQVKSVNISSNDIHLIQGMNAIALSFSNINGSDNVTIDNNTVVITPKVDVARNQSFMLVGRPAMEQLLNETNATASIRTVNRSRPVSVADFFLIQNNRVTYAQPSGNHSYGLLMVDIYATPKISIVSNMFNVSTGGVIACGMWLENFSDITTLEIENNTLSGGGSSKGETALLAQFVAPFKNIPTLLVKNAIAEFWGEVGAAVGFLFTGEFGDTLKNIRVENVRASVIGTFKKLATVIDFTNLKPKKQLDRIDISRVTVGTTMMFPFQLMVVVKLGNGTTLDVKNFVISDCNVGPLAAPIQFLLLGGEKDAQLKVADEFRLQGNKFICSVDDGSAKYDAAFVAVFNKTKLELADSVTAQLLDNTITMAQKAGTKKSTLLEFASSNVQCRNLKLSNNSISLESKGASALVLSIKYALNISLTNNTLTLTSGVAQAGVLELTCKLLDLTSKPLVNVEGNTITSTATGRATGAANTALLRLTCTALLDLFTITNNTIAMDSGKSTCVLLHLTSNYKKISVAENVISFKSNINPPAGNTGGSTGLVKTDAVFKAPSSVSLNISFNNVSMVCPRACFVANFRVQIHTADTKDAVITTIERNNVVFKKPKDVYPSALLMLKKGAATSKNTFDPSIKAETVEFYVNNNSVTVDDNSSSQQPVSTPSSRVVLVWSNVEVDSTGGNKKFLTQVHGNSLDRGGWGFAGTLSLLCLWCTHACLNETTKTVSTSMTLDVVDNKIFTAGSPADVPHGHNAAFFLTAPCSKGGLLPYNKWSTEHLFILQNNHIYCTDCVARRVFLANASGNIVADKWTVQASRPCNLVFDSQRPYSMVQKMFNNGLLKSNATVALCGSFTASMTPTFTDGPSNTTSSSLSLSESGSTTRTVTVTLSNTPTWTSSITPTTTVTLTPPPTPSTSSTWTKTPPLTQTRNSTTMSASETESDNPTRTQTFSLTSISASKTASERSRSGASGSESPKSVSLEFVRIPLPGLDPEEREAVAQATGTALTVAMFMAPSPAAGLGASRGLAVFALLGCRSNDEGGRSWKTRKLLYPFSLLPGVGWGVDEGYYARAAIVSFLIPIAVAILAALAIGWVRVRRTWKSMDEYKRKVKRKDRRRKRLEKKKKDMADGEEHDDENENDDNNANNGDDGHDHDDLLGGDGGGDNKKKKQVANSVTDAPLVHENTLDDIERKHAENQELEEEMRQLDQEEAAMTTGRSELTAAAEEEARREGKFKALLLRSPFPDYLTQTLSIFAGSLPVSCGILFGVADGQIDTNMCYIALSIFGGIVLLCCIYANVTVYAKDGPKLTESAIYYNPSFDFSKSTAQCLFTDVAKWTIIHTKIYDVQPTAPAAKSLQARRFVQRMRVWIDFWGPEFKDDDISEELADQQRELRRKAKADAERAAQLKREMSDAMKFQDPLLSGAAVFSDRNSDMSDDDDEEELDENEEIPEPPQPRVHEYKANDADYSAFEGSAAYMCQADEFAGRYEEEEFNNRKFFRKRALAAKRAARRAAKAAALEAALEEAAKRGDELGKNSGDDDSDDSEQDPGLRLLPKSLRPSYKDYDSSQKRCGVGKNNDDESDDFDIDIKIHRNKLQQWISLNYIGIAFFATFVVALLQGFAFISPPDKCREWLLIICCINFGMLPIVLLVRPCMMVADNCLLIFVELCTFTGSMLAVFLPPPPPLSVDQTTARAILDSPDYDQSVKLYMLTQLCLTTSGLVVSLILVLIGAMRFIMLTVSGAVVISVGMYRKRVAQEIALLNIFDEFDKEKQKEMGMMDEMGLEADEMLF